MCTGCLPFCCSRHECRHARFVIIISSYYRQELSALLLQAVTGLPTVKPVRRSALEARPGEDKPGDQAAAADDMMRQLLLQV